MTPLDTIGWALALGIAWFILSSCIPIESWISSLIAALAKRRGDRVPDEPAPHESSDD